MAGPLPKAREARRSAAAAKESMENKHKTLIGQIETQEKKLEARPKSAVASVPSRSATRRPRRRS